MDYIDYKELYEATFKYAKQLYDAGSYDNETLEAIFPELKESEDEKIRKWLICYFKEVCDNVSDKEKKGVIAWLEKQGEQKPADKVEPKFKVGDEIKTKNEESFTITRIDRWGYWSEDLFICGFDDAAKWELAEQKPAWSEEDEYNFAWLYETLIGFDGNDLESYNTPEFLEKCKKVINWFKCLKDRYTWKPSDEQIMALRWVLNHIPYDSHKEEISGLLDQIKDL